MSKEEENEFDFSDEVEKDIKKEKKKWKLLPGGANEWLTFVILLLVFFIAWAYWKDMQGCQAMINHFQNVCSCPNQ